MSKVRQRMSDILPHPPKNDEEIGQGQEKQQIPDKDKVAMTRIQFTSLIAKAVEDQKNLADATSAEVVKVVFKHGSERHRQPSHSSPMEFEKVRSVLNPIMTDGEYGLNAFHLLRPATGNAMAPSSVYNAIPVQQAAKLSVISTNNGVTDGNKTFQTMGSFITGKRYKRETNLKVL